MKAREQRQKVMIRARMRSGSAWHDVCILNLSANGLGIQSADPPQRGTYVEICRGRQTVIARVAWNKGHKAGLRSQDPIFIQALISDTRPNLPALAQRGQFIERRHQPRPASRPSADAHEWNRLKSRLIEFGAFGVIAAALAMAALSMVVDVFNRPLSAVSAALDRPSETPAASENGEKL